MASNDEQWRRKMLVQNVPEDWSEDMLENFIEVVTKAELEEDGVMRFCGVKHTVLLTFSQPLTGQHVENAEAKSAQRQKPLVYSLLAGAPAAILIRDIGPAVTQDNLFFYFESSCSGGREGEVKTCELYPDYKMAVIVFSSPEVVASVLAVKQHSPTTGTHINVEPCFEQFHKKILDDLKSQQPVPVSPSENEIGGSSNYSQPKGHAASGWEKPSAVTKPCVPPKPVLSVPRSQQKGYIASEQYTASEQSGPSYPQKGSRPFTQPHEYSDKQGGRGGHYPRRGGERKRRHRPRGDKRGQHGSREDFQQSGRPLGNGGNQRSRGGPPFGHYQKRGRGYGQRGGYAPRGSWRPQATELFDSGPAHVASSAQSAVPQPVVLDADCNPVPHDWRSPSKTGHDASAFMPESEDYYEMEEGEESDGLDASLEEISLKDSPYHPQVVKESVQRSAANPTSAQPLLFLEQHSATAVSGKPFLPKTSNQSGTRRWAEAREAVPSPQNNTQAQLEAERLKREKMELEKKDQLREQEKVRLEKELEKVRQENEALQNRRRETMSFPAYQLHLMQEFAQGCTLCDIIIHEKEGTVEFYGAGDNFDTAKCAFLFTLQDRVEDSISISPVIATILRTDEGQGYLRDLSEGYAQCAFDIQDTCIVCTAFNMNYVQDALADLKRNIYQEKIKVNKTTLLALQTLKQQLEKDFPLARITLPNSDSTDSMVIVDGLNGEFEMVKRELRDYCSRNEPGKGEFRITGLLETKACKQWCSKELDEVKVLILKNNGDCKLSDDSSLVSFAYQCQKDVLAEVQHKLNSIRKVTKVSRIDLQHELKRYSERALVISGIHSIGIEPFCRLMEGKLKKDSGWDTIIHFNIPVKCNLPEFKYSQTKHSAARAHRPRQPPAPRRSRQTGYHRHRHSSIRSFTTTVGKSSLTIKSGDIATESVDGIVCVVGEDMDLRQTAVGQAILKKYPQCAQSLPQGSGQPAGRVITHSLLNPMMNVLRGALQNPRQQEVSTFYFVILTKWPQQLLMAQLKTLVQKCLQSAVQQGNRSVAFPPLGMGRKFQFPLKVVVDAMVTTAYQFLQSNPGSLQSVTFVIYDVGAAREFREATKKIINPPKPAFMDFPQQAVDSASDEDEDDADDDSDGGDFFSSPAGDFFSAARDNDGGGDASRDSGGSDNDDDDELTFSHFDDDDDQGGPTFFTPMAPVSVPSSGGFEAQVCLRDQQHFNTMRLGLLRELRSTFLHEDRLTDIRTFKKLGMRAMDHIKSTAAKNCVVLSVQSMGGREALLVRGQKAGVAETMALIKDKLHAHLQREENRDHHHTGSLPSASHRIRLPSYWKVCQDKIFKDFEQFWRDHRTYGKLYTMGADVSKEIEGLIRSTWVQHLVGAGKDARNLRHQGIKVVKVERLENPQLWEEYCTHRERLIRRMKQQAFQPVEKVKGSTGPVRTTSNLSRHSLLNREMFPQVNEHYMFHGTKKEYLQAIHDQGLDTRIASEGAMLGRGVYAAESATKADQYTDSKTQRLSGSKTMLLMRVLLGEPFINKQTSPTKFSRPPCKRCYQDKCTCQGGAFFDSVIDDAGRNFREFVIYDRCMCYPEYFISYQRI